MKRLKIKIAIIAVSILLLGVVFISCSKSTSSLPPVNGYNTSNDVAASNLLVHWTFENTLNETISNTAPATNTATTSYVTGPKGKALQISGGYIKYPVIAAINTANAFPSVTVSAWVKVDNNGSTYTTFFALTNPAQADWNQGPVEIGAETGHGVATDDTLALHGHFSTYSTGSWQGGDNINDYGVRGTDFQTVHGTNQWVHYVLRYDGSGSNIDLYANGVRVSNNNFRNRAVAGVGLGPIVNQIPIQALIGAVPNANSGYPNAAAQTWQGLFTGSIDEIRVYSKALTDLEIGSLYTLELAGR